MANGLASAPVASSAVHELTFDCQRKPFCVTSRQHYLAYCCGGGEKRREEKVRQQHDESRQTLKHHHDKYTSAYLANSSLSCVSLWANFELFLVSRFSFLVAGSMLALRKAKRRRYK